MNFRPFRCQTLLPVCLCLLPLLAAAQPKSDLRNPPLLPQAEGERLGRELVAELLSQKPTENSKVTGMLEIRTADRKVRQVPVKFEIFATPTNTISTYETTSGPALVKLTVIHALDRANDYELLEGDAPPKKLAGNETMVPFAGSDFWIGDLGLEFLHWPKQRVLKKEMSRSVFCHVLESTNPNPATGAYSQVVSWVGADKPGIVIVYAKAFDAKGAALKEFNPKKLEKVDGQWQLEQMEIYNFQTRSRTRITFNVGQ
jgi:hypothetical protein